MEVQRSNHVFIILDNTEFLPQFFRELFNTLLSVPRHTNSHRCHLRAASILLSESAAVLSWALFPGNTFKETGPADVGTVGHYQNVHLKCLAIFCDKQMEM